MRFLNWISVLANGAGAAKNDKASGSDFLENTVVKALVGFGSKLWNWFMTFFVKIVQFMLRIVDFFQFFVGKLAGIDTWSTKNNVGRVSLTDTDVIFRFLLSDQVIKILTAIFGLAIVLLIIFTIIAIVKTDYAAAVDADGKADGSKRGVLKKAGRSLFVMFIVPFVLIFGILSSNAILASLSNAIKGGTTQSLGGQIFTASSYEANMYRKYAENGNRIFVDYGSEVLRTVYEPEKGSDALGGLVDVKMNGKDARIFVAPMGYSAISTESNFDTSWGSFKTFFTSKANSYNEAGCAYFKVETVNYTVASEEEAIRKFRSEKGNDCILGSVEKAGEGSYNVEYYQTAGMLKFMSNYSTSGVGSSSGWVKAEYHALGANGAYATNGVALGNMPSASGEFKIGEYDYIVLPELTVDGKAQKYVGNSGVPVSMYALGYMGDSKDDNNIIGCVYASWKYNKYFKENMASGRFEDYVTTVAMGSTTMLSGATRDDLSVIYNSANSHGKEGLFAPIADEYYVMADFIDWAVEYGVQFYFVNSNNNLIKWQKDLSAGISTEVETKYLTGISTGTTIDNVSGFVVEYDSGVNRYYGTADRLKSGVNSTNGWAANEVDGSTFIVCTKVGDYYVPITQASSRAKGFVSSYLNSTYRGPIVARGLFSSGWNDGDGVPTYIAIRDQKVESVAYYGIDKNNLGGCLADRKDNIDGSLTGYQAASGTLCAYNTKGELVANAEKIAFTHIKVDDIYVTDGVQYIKLHFYRSKVENPVSDDDYSYVFSATVLGKKSSVSAHSLTAASTAGNSDNVYTSNLFDTSTTFVVGGSNYPTVPNDNKVLEATIDYIYFIRGSIDKRLVLDFAIGFNGLKAADQYSAFYARFHLTTMFETELSTVYNLTSGSATLDYNFVEKDGIGMSYLYRAGDLNIIILTFASVLIFTVLGQAVWGLIKRILEITMLFVIYPGVASTIPLSDDRFKNWSSSVVKKVFAAYGVVLGLNLFFVLLPVVREATDIFKTEDIPAALAGKSLFGNADFLNRVVYIMFVLVLFTMIKSLPSLIANFVGGEEAASEGAKVQKDVKETTARVGNVMSGKAAWDAGKNAMQLAGNFIPGKPLVDKTVAWGKKKWDDAKSKRLEDKAKKADKGDSREVDEEKKKLDEKIAERRKEREDDSARADGAPDPTAGLGAGGGPDVPPVAGGRTGSGSDDVKADGIPDAGAGSTGGSEVPPIAGGATDTTLGAGAGDVKRLPVDLTFDKISDIYRKVSAAGDKGVRLSKEEKMYLDSLGLSYRGKGKIVDKDGNEVWESRAREKFGDMKRAELDERIKSIAGDLDRTMESGLSSDIDGLRADADKLREDTRADAEKLKSDLEKKLDDVDIKADETMSEVLGTKSILAQNKMGFESSDEFKEKKAQEEKDLKKNHPEEYYQQKALEQSAEWAEKHGDKTNIFQKTLMAFGGGKLVEDFKNMRMQHYTDTRVKRAINKGQRERRRTERWADRKSSMINYWGKHYKEFGHAFKFGFGKKGADNEAAGVITKRYKAALKAGKISKGVVKIAGLPITAIKWMATNYKGSKNKLQELKRANVSGIVSREVKHFAAVSGVTMTQMDGLSTNERRRAMTGKLTQKEQKAIVEQFRKDHSLDSKAKLSKAQKTELDNAIKRAQIKKAKDYRSRVAADLGDEGLKMIVSRMKNLRPLKKVRVRNESGNIEKLDSYRKEQKRNIKNALNTKEAQEMIKNAAKGMKSITKKNIKAEARAKTADSTTNKQVEAAVLKKNEAVVAATQKHLEALIADNNKKLAAATRTAGVQAEALKKAQKQLNSMSKKLSQFEKAMRDGDLNAMDKINNLSRRVNGLSGRKHDDDSSDEGGDE